MRLIDVTCPNCGCKIHVEPEPQWIPVTERLPELNKEVLATDEDGFLYIAQLDLSRYTGNTYWEETTEYVSIEVVAWQPLPEPYREEATDETP